MIIEYAPRILDGTLRTLEITALAFVIATVIGIPITGVLRARRRPVREVGRFVVLILRGLPELVAVYLLYYGFGSEGVNVVPLLAVCLALGLIQAAFVAEIYGASLRTVAGGQREAAAAIGLRSWQQWWLVIIPQAVRFSVPPLVNTFLSLLKLSVVASAIGVGDLLYEAQSIMNINFKIAPIALVTVGIFLVITLPLTGAARILERRLRVGRAGR